MSTPEQPDVDRPGTSPEPSPAAPAQPSIVPPVTPPVAPPMAPPVAPPVAPPQGAAPTGWGEPPRYGQYAPPSYGQPAAPQGAQPEAGQGPAAPAAPGYGAPGYGAPGYGTQPGYGAPTPYGMPTAPGFVPQADKPGIIPLRPLTLGEIYDGAFSAVRHNPKVMLGLSVLVIVVATLVGTVVGLLLVPLMTSLVGPIFDDPAMAEAGVDLGVGAGDIAQLYATSLGAALTFMLAGPIVNGLLTVSVSRSVLGERATVKQVWEKVGPRVWLLIGWSLLQSLVLLVAIGAFTALGVLVAIALADVSGALAGWSVVLLVILAIVVTVWLTTRLLLVPPALALENTGMFASIRRAWVLTRGSFWRTFGIYLLASFIVGVIAQVVAVPIGLLSSLFMFTGAGAGALTVTTILSTAVGTAITSIFLAGVVALLYIDLRMRREGLDVSLAAAAGAQQH